MYERWGDGIFPPLRADLQDYVASTGLRQHDFLGAVSSSQAFAFNLFFPFRLAGADRLGDVLGDRLGRRLRVEGIDFEVRGPTDVLGEWRGSQPEAIERYTTSDVGIRVTEAATGQAGIVLVEVKLSEGDFTACGGAASPANRAPEACASAATFLDAPERCYLRRPLRATKDRRYWDIFRNTGTSASLREVFPGAGSGRCPFEGGCQQIMRNHALALGLVQAGAFAFSAFGLAHHDDNPDVVPVWDAYQGMTSLDGLFRLPASDLLAATNDSGWWPEWRLYLRQRYDLPAGKDPRSSGGKPR